jgi:hypothetical protein
LDVIESIRYMPKSSCGGDIVISGDRDRKGAINSRGGVTEVSLIYDRSSANDSGKIGLIVLERSADLGSIRRAAAGENDMAGDSGDLSFYYSR